MEFLSITAIFRRTFSALLVVPAAWFAVFFLWPTIHAFVSLISTEAINDTLTSSSTWKVLWFTTWQAAISVVVTLIISLPVTWVLARFHFRGSNWIRGIISAPFVLPTVVVAGAVMAVLPLRYQFGVHSIVIAHVLFNIAVVVRIVGQRWQSISIHQAHAAATLGAHPTRTFVHVTLPQLKYSIVNAVLITFVFTFTSFGAVFVLGGVRHRTVEVEVYTYAVRLGEFDTAVVLSLIQVLSITAVLLFSSVILRHQRNVHSTDVSQMSLSQQPQHRATIWVIAVGTAALVALPFIAVFLRSFRTGNSWTITAWTNLWNGTLEQVGLDIREAILHSITFAVTATVITLPLAYVIASAVVYAKKMGRLVQSLTTLPIIVSAVTLGFGIIVTFDQSPFDWRSQTWLLPVVHSLVALPLVVHLLTPSLQAVSPLQRQAAQTLGASPLAVWWHIDRRTMRGPLLAGSAMSFAVSLGEFGATSFLTRSSSTTLPIAISQLLSRPGTLLQNSGFALAALLAVMTAAVMSRA